MSNRDYIYNCNANYNSINETVMIKINYKNNAV